MLWHSQSYLNEQLENCHLPYTNQQVYSIMIDCCLGIMFSMVVTCLSLFPHNMIENSEWHLSCSSNFKWKIQSICGKSMQIYSNCCGIGINARGILVQWWKDCCVRPILHLHDSFADWKFQRSDLGLLWIKNSQWYLKCQWPKPKPSGKMCFKSVRENSNEVVFDFNYLES